MKPQGVWINLELETNAIMQCVCAWCKEENYDNQRFWCFNSVIRSPIAKSFLIRKTYARVCACAVVFWPVCICVLNRSKRHVRDVLPRPASQTTDNLWPWSTSDATNFKDFKYNQVTDWLRSLQINFERTVSSNYHTPLSPTQVPLVSPVTPPSFCVGPVPSCGEEQYRLLVARQCYWCCDSKCNPTLPYPTYPTQLEQHMGS